MSDPLAQWAEQQQCPGCGEYQVTIEYVLEAKPIGSFSIAGSQPKVVATGHPYLVCKSCGARARGRYSHDD